MDLAFRAVDADQHYYEALDACTRHLDPRFRDARRAGRAARQAHAPARGREPVPVHPQPDVRSDHRARVPRPMFRGQVPEGVDPRTLTQVEPLRREYQDPRRASRGARRAGTRAHPHVPDARVRRRAGAALRHPGDGGDAARVQPLARGGLGLRVRRPADRRARCSRSPIPRRRLAELDYLVEHGARMVHVRPAPVPDGHGRRPVAGRRAPRSRCGRVSRRRRSRLRSTSATVVTRRPRRRVGRLATSSSRSAGSTR